jgi:hypothetical protein
MLGLWSSCWTVSVGTAFLTSRCILSSVVTYAALVLCFFRHNPLQCTVIPFA